MLQFLARLFGRAPKSSLPPFNFATNRYRAKKTWPPDLRALTEKQQFRFERKWKRRLLAKSIKPQWNKWTKIVQWNLIGFVIVYGVLFHDYARDPMNPRPGEQPFKELRGKMWAIWDGLWTHTSTNEARTRAEARSRLGAELPAAPGPAAVAAAAVPSEAPSASAAAAPPTSATEEGVSATNQYKIQR